MSDASFEDGAERPLKLRAFEDSDLQIISAVVQDAVFPGAQMTWHPSKRRFAILVNRFRWEDVENAEKRGRKVERVQSVLAVEDVTKVQSQGVEQGAKDVVYSILSIGFQSGEDGMGTVEVLMAGDGVLRLSVEALEVTITDVTKPYIAPSGQVPSHSDD